MELMEPINTLWFEGRLGYMERLSIATALAQGHPVTIFSYRPETLEGVPDGVQVRNAAEVMNDRRRVCLFEGKFKALGSDFFRYELFAQQLGYWMDLDVILLRPLTFATRSQPVHNAYLVARAERGWAGEIALILLLGGIATAAFLTAFKNTRATHSGVALGSGAALVAVGLHSNFEYAVLTSSILSLVFVNAALVSSSRARELQSRVRTPTGSLPRQSNRSVREGV